MQDSTRGIAPSPTFTFLNLETDDKRKKTHHEALRDILAIFKNAGMTHYNISHIDDPERDKNVPIMIGKHQYDLSFPKDNNTIVLLEVKILKLRNTKKDPSNNGSSESKIPPG